LTYLLGPVEVEDCAVASLVMVNGAVAALSATLGSHREISRLRLCFENVTFESVQTPYAPATIRGKSCRPLPKQPSASRTCWKTISSSHRGSRV